MPYGTLFSVARFLSFRFAIMRILYLGETWKGSCARSMQEALAAQPDIIMDEIGEDHFFPKHRMKVLRGVHRLLGWAYRKDLKSEVISRCDSFAPQVLMVYKGNGVERSLISGLRKKGIFTVNIFPDYSPLVYGSRLQEAIGEYDLVISTKPFHPAIWNSTYAYSNQCVFVPHGYDPKVHLWNDEPLNQDLDVVIAANARPEYERLMLDIAEGLCDESLRVGVAGPGWDTIRHKFPSSWQFPGPIHGRSYGEWLRRGQIAIAPVNTEVVVGGERQPGDEDTTRTYELAAARCFFLHRRTPFVRSVFDEATEVPMWSDSAELVRLIRHFLPQEKRRREMATAAYQRAVPRYSIDSRAADVLAYVTGAMHSGR